MAQECDLQNVLSTPNDTMIFVESIMDRYDAPAAVTTSSNKGAELDYGPRGPQYRENAQLRPAMQKSDPSLLDSTKIEESDERSVGTRLVVHTDGQ
jgi:hypothetical protein